MSYVDIHGITDTGLLRKNNEDNIFIMSDLLVPSSEGKGDRVSLSDAIPLMVVADGMGGEAAGEVASSIAIDALTHYIYDKILTGHYKDIRGMLDDAQDFAHQSILKHIKKNPELIGMGTTSVLAIIIEGHIYISWVGDSRAYLFSERRDQVGVNYEFRMLSDDHSLVWDEVTAGNMTPEQARLSDMSNIITQSLGDPNKRPVPGFIKYRIHDDIKLLLLCSDGLNSMISDEEIADSIASTINLGGNIVCEKLIAKANIAGGKDNISIITCSFNGRFKSKQPDAVFGNSTKSALSSKLRSTIKLKPKKKYDTFIVILWLIAISSGLLLTLNTLDILELETLFSSNDKDINKKGTESTEMLDINEDSVETESKIWDLDHNSIMENGANSATTEQTEPLFDNEFKTNADPPYEKDTPTDHLEKFDTLIGKDQNEPINVEPSTIQYDTGQFIGLPKDDFIGPIDIKDDTYNYPDSKDTSNNLIKKGSNLHKQ